MRRCTRCRHAFPVVMFRKIGAGRRHSWCRQCESETAGIRQAARLARERTTREALR